MVPEERQQDIPGRAAARPPIPREFDVGDGADGKWHPPRACNSFVHNKNAHGFVDDVGVRSQAHVLLLAVTLDLDGTNLGGKRTAAIWEVTYNFFCVYESFRAF